MSRERVSVVIPTYNRRHCLENALKSVLAQSHTDWEVIIVDDGSTDDTAKWIAENYGSDSRFRYIFQENAGVSKARNTALAFAKGDFIAFLDSDDLWKPWKLEMQLACLRSLPQLGMVWTDMEAIDSERAVVDPRHLRTMYSAYRFFPAETLFERDLPLAQIAPASAAAADGGAVIRFGDIYPSMIMGNLVHTSTVLLRRDRLDHVKGFDESLGYSGEDYDFHLRTCEAGPVGLLDLPAIQYQVGQPDQLTRHKRLIAQNFLKTVERAIAGTSGHRFARDRVHHVLAEANSWNAEEDFKARDASGVRRHAWASLRRRPLQTRLLLLLALSCMPVSMLEPVLYALRSLRNRRRGA